ncbi:MULTISPECIES: hypothetical protein [unclassified Streptomyces]|uniref:hypothetical protein n=1 Tax=unclassified Streptomyces TaxID=2593676 RepID=UPI000B151C9C|nr:MULTISPECIES: hypothetical protein [unclassified Streptomyces]
MRLAPARTALAAAAAAVTAAAAALLCTPPAEAAPPSGTAAAPAATVPAPAPAARVAAAPGTTVCAPAASLRSADGRPVAAGLCVTPGGASMTVTASADCACTTSGTWTARRGEEPAGSGTLGARAAYPGPGTYEITAEVRVADTRRSGTAAGTVTGTFTLATPLPEPSHRIEVAPAELRPGATTTLTYTVERVSDDGDGSARLGLIGEAATGIRLVSTDVRCINPLTGRYPSTERSPHAVDCALTDLQPGRPATVTVHATLPPGAPCSTVVAKLGYWTPRGQQVAGAMIDGPTVTCG